MFMSARKTLELNPTHPIIRELASRAQAGADEAELTPAVRTLYETALLSSGFTIEKPNDFAARVYSLLGASLGVSTEESAAATQAETASQPQVETASQPQAETAP